MIVALIDKKLIARMRKNHELKQELSKQNDIDIAAVNALLRKQANGLSHGLKLTNIVNWQLIKKAYNIENDDEYLNIVSIDIKASRKREAKKRKVKVISVD